MFQVNWPVFFHETEAITVLKLVSILIITAKSSAGCSFFMFNPDEDKTSWFVLLQPQLGSLIQLKSQRCVRAKIASRAVAEQTSEGILVDADTKTHSGS